MKVLEKQLTVDNPKGIHGRIATKMIKIASRHDVRLCIICEGQTVDCTSVLDILSVALVHGTTFTLRLAGKQTERAMTAVEKLITGADES